MTFLQNALLFQLHGKVQASLSADAGDDGIGTLKANNPGNILQRQRLHIDLIRDGGVGHDGCGIGIAQDYLVAFLFQRKACLRTGIVKFRCLTDYDRAGANNQNLMNICTFRHVWLPPSSQ